MVGPLWFLLWQLVVLYVAGCEGNNELELACGDMVVTKEPNDVMYYKALMNLQYGRWTWKATMNFQGNDEMDEKKWTCEAVRNLQDEELMVKNATEHLHDEQVNNNGWCEAARNLLERSKWVRVPQEGSQWVRVPQERSQWVGVPQHYE